MGLNFIEEACPTGLRPSALLGNHLITFGKFDRLIGLLNPLFPFPPFPCRVRI